MSFHACESNAHFDCGSRHVDVSAPSVSRRRVWTGLWAGGGVSEPDLWPSGCRSSEPPWRREPSIVSKRAGGAAGTPEIRSVDHLPALTAHLTHSPFKESVAIKTFKKKNIWCENSSLVVISNVTFYSAFLSQNSYNIMKMLHYFIKNSTFERQTYEE